MPKGAFAKAQARIMASWVDRQICSPFYRVLIRKDQKERDDAFAELLANLRVFAKNIHPQGPFFYGTDLSIVDVALAPWAYRFYILEHYRGKGFGIPANDTTLSPYFRWYDAVVELPAVKDTLQDKKKLAAVYERYADASAKSMVGDAVRAGKEAHDI